MVKGTHENIINAFFRLASREPHHHPQMISIAEIATEAGLSRQSVYRKHFKNTDEILTEIFQEIDDNIFRHFKQYLTDKKGDTNASILDFLTNTFFPLVYEHRMQLRVLYRTASESPWKRFLDDRYTQLLSSKEIIHSSDPTLISDDDMCEIIAHFTMILISNWMKEEFPDTPEVFTKKYLKLIESPLLALTNIDSSF